MRPARGEVWYADLSPVSGHEQAGVRPVLVISTDRVNRDRMNLVVMVPLTTSSRVENVRIPIYPPEGGLRWPSYALCAHVRSIDATRLDRRLGRVTDATVFRVARAVGWLIGLSSPRPPNLPPDDPNPASVPG
jgi:mRNA interferase MazF